MKYLSAVPLVLLSVTLPAIRHEPSADMCSLAILREQPGYRYTVQQIQDLVGEAEVVVRVEAVDSFRVNWPTVPQPRDTPLDEMIMRFPIDLIRFRTVEVLRWPDPAEVLGGRTGPGEFALWGRVVDTDDFNPLPVPYGMVRRSGQRGSCYTSDYRIGGEYLFLMIRQDNELTPLWSPLSPTNEQIRGDDDPWLQWVREQLAQDA